MQCDNRFWQTVYVYIPTPKNYKIKGVIILFTKKNYIYSIIRCYLWKIYTHVYVVLIAECSAGLFHRRTQINILSFQT